jgi:hypothetical protein
MGGHGGQLVVVDVDRHHGGAEGARHLHAVAADAPHADHHRQAARRDAGAAHRLIGRGQRVGDDGHLRQREAGARQAAEVDLAQAAARHHDVGAEAALDVVARHLLRAADGAQAAPAQVAFAAGQHCRHDDRLAGPGLGAVARGDDDTADLMAQRQRQRLVGAHAVVVVAQVGVAHATAGDLDDHLAGARPGFEVAPLQGRAGGGHDPAVGSNRHRVSSWCGRVCCRVLRQLTPGLSGWPGSSWASRTYEPIVALKYQNTDAGDSGP